MLQKPQIVRAAMAVPVVTTQIQRAYHFWTASTLAFAFRLPEVQSWPNAEPHFMTADTLTQAVALVTVCPSTRAAGVSSLFLGTNKKTKAKKKTQKSFIKKVNFFSTFKDTENMHLRRFH